MNMSRTHTCVEVHEGSNEFVGAAHTPSNDVAGATHELGHAVDYHICTPFGRAHDERSELHSNETNLGRLKYTANMLRET